MPNDATAIEAVLAAMPARVAGLARLEARPNQTHYEGDALVAVMQLGVPSEEASATSVLEYLRRLSEAGEIGEVEVEEEQLDGSLVYTIYRTVGNNRHVYLVSWGAADAGFAFSAKAPSAEVRKALVQAFVEASSRD